MQNAFSQFKQGGSYKKSAFDKYTSKPKNKRFGHFSKPKTSASLMESALARHGIGRQVQSALIVQKASEILLEILPSHAKPDVKAVWFQRGELLIGCYHPAAVEETEPFSEQLMNGLLREFPDVTLETITIKFHPQAFQSNY